jgi:hypothetical protein
MDFQAPLQSRSSHSRRSVRWMASFLLIAFAQSAGAAMTLDLEWTATTGSGVPGSNAIYAQPGDEVTLDIIATVDEVGVDAYQVSVAFDLNQLDELDLIEAIEFDHQANVDCDPLIEEQLGPFPACFTNFGNELVNATPGTIELEIESSPGVEGLAGGFEAVAEDPPPDAGVVSLSFRVGRVRFLVTDNVASNGFDLEGTLILEPTKDNAGDGYVSNDLMIQVLPESLPSGDFTPGFASVNVPEPSAAVLVAAALAGVGWLRRSTRLRVARARS